MKIISLLQRPNDWGAVSCLTATSSVPLSLAIGHIPCNHRIKELAPTPAGMFHIEEWIRKVTYLLCRTNKQSVTASSSAEEERICIPPTSSSSSMEVAPSLGGHRWGRSCYRQAAACNSTHQKERIRFPDQGVQLQHRWRVIGTHCKVARKIYSENNKNLKHTSRGKGSEYNYLIWAMMWKVKLKTNEAKARKRYWGGAAKTSNNHIPPWGFMQGLTHLLSSSSWWPVSAFDILHFHFNQ